MSVGYPHLSPAFVQTAKRALVEGRSADFLRNGLANPLVPVREIAVWHDRGTVQHEFQVRIDPLPGGTHVRFKADVFCNRFRTAQQRLERSPKDILASDLIASAVPTNILQGVALATIDDTTTLTQLFALPTMTMFSLAAMHTLGFARASYAFLEILPVSETEKGVQI